MESYAPLGTHNLINRYTNHTLSGRLKYVVCVVCVRKRERWRKLRDEVARDVCYLFGIYTHKIADSPSGVKCLIYAGCHKAQHTHPNPTSYLLLLSLCLLLIFRSFVIQQIPSSNLFMVVVDNKCHCRDFGPITMDPVEIMYIL